MIAFYDHDEDLGVVVLANGNWRRVGGHWPLQQIMPSVRSTPRRLTARVNG